MEAVVHERIVYLRLLQREILYQDLVDFGYSEQDILEPMAPPWIGEQMTLESVAQQKLWRSILLKSVTSL